MSETVQLPAELPFGSVDKKGPGWWGVLSLIATEAALFGYLLFGYAFTAAVNGPGWGPSHPPSLRLAGPDTAILLASSVAAWWGEKGAKSGRKGQGLAGAGLAFVAGAVFVAVQLVEWRDKPFTLSSSGYGSHYFTITGFHLAHVLAGLLGLLLIMIWTAAGYIDRQRHAAVTYVATYWHFVDAVWVVVFASFYIAPRLGWP